jgi:hypothetical protein
MNVTSFFRALLRRERGAPFEVAAARVERRHPAYRCAGCNGWGESLIFMSNGRDYCLPCARTVSSWFGSHPAGRRHDDLKSLNEPVSFVASVANR